MISSSRVTLTPMLESDVSDEYIANLNDKEYMKFSRNSNFTHTIGSQVRYISNILSSNNLLFAIKNIESKQLLGSISCYIEFSNMTLDLGFLIFKNEQGMGYASEALELLISYLEAQFPGMTAVIGSNRDNIAMHAVAQKLDFQIVDKNSNELSHSVRFIRPFPKLNSLSLPVVPDFMLNAKRIGVAVHDAGGAEHISWLLRNIPQKVRAVIAGPAKRIFTNSGILFDEMDQLSEIMECDVVITGSGWMSQLEVTAIKEAKLRKIPCITVLDHWVNYLERFGEDENSKPQILAVTNSLALQIAHEKFPNQVVWLLPDFQLKNYQDSIKQTKSEPTSALILLEPNSSSISEFPVNGEAIENLIKSALSLKRVRGLIRVVIRPHPSQRYDETLIIMLKQLYGEVEVSERTLLLEDLEISGVVLGLSSYALYISAMCGIDTYSCFAGMKGHWTERFPRISPLPALQ